MYPTLSSTLPPLQRLLPLLRLRPLLHLQTLLCPPPLLRRSCSLLRQSRRCQSLPLYGHLAQRLHPTPVRRCTCRLARFAAHAQPQLHRTPTLQFRHLLPLLLHLQLLLVVVVVVEVARLHLWLLLFPHLLLRLLLLLVVVVAVVSQLHLRLLLSHLLLPLFPHLLLLVLVVVLLVVLVWTCTGRQQYALCARLQARPPQLLQLPSLTHSRPRVYRPATRRLSVTHGLTHSWA